MDYFAYQEGDGAQLNLPLLLEYGVVKFSRRAGNMPLMSNKLNNYELSQRDTYEGGFFSRGTSVYRKLRIEY